jgi:hypothetical protein
VREMSRDAAGGDRSVAPQAAARHGKLLSIFGIFTYDPTSSLAGIFTARVARKFLHDIRVGASELEPADRASPKQLGIMDDE